MNCHHKIYDLRKTVFALSLVACLLLPVVGAAQQHSAGSVGIYPEGLTGQGCIDSITAKSVVIDDSAFEFTADATFHTIKSPKAPRSVFRPGVWVGYMTNSQKQIDSLWYLRSCE
jgi:hypothetical protein